MGQKTLFIYCFHLIVILGGIKLYVFASQYNKFSGIALYTVEKFFLTPAPAGAAYEVLYQLTPFWISVPIAVLLVMISGLLARFLN